MVEILKLKTVIFSLSLSSLYTVEQLKRPLQHTIQWFIKVVKQISNSRTKFFIIYYYYWHIHPPITRKRRSVVRARLGVAGHLSTTLRWGEFR